MSAMAKASGMPPSVGSSVAALTGSMITYAATTNTPATRSGIPDERPGATGRTGTPAPMRQSRRGIIHALTTRTTAPTPRSAHLPAKTPTAPASTWALLGVGAVVLVRSEEHTSELQSLRHLVCRLLLEKKNKTTHI